MLVTYLDSSPWFEGRPAVEMALTSERMFPVMGTMPVLHLGPHEVSTGRYPDDGDLHTLIFTVAQEVFDSLDLDTEVRVTYPGVEAAAWSFGPLRAHRVVASGRAIPRDNLDPCNEAK